MSGQLLKASANALYELYPDHIDVIRAGLLLAVCGRVKHVDTDQWDVRGQNPHNGKTFSYRVTNMGTVWLCNCQNFKSATLQNIEFLDSTARHLCKHITAVAICRGAMLYGYYPEPEVNIYDTISNIVAAQHLPKPGEAWLIPGTTVKLARINRDGRDVVVLQTGRTRSAALVTWVSNPAMPSRGMWHLTHDAWDKYCKFVEDTYGVKVQRQEGQHVTL